MKIIGLTGGIGSGKTKVLNFFMDKGIPCYNSDKQAKLLLNSNSKLITQVKKQFGDKVYDSNNLNSKVLSEIVFKNTKALKTLNSIVHPFVAKSFLQFTNNNASSLIFKESAVLFESNSYLLCDYTILITAPLEVRIDRILRRDSIHLDDIKARISNQWTDQKKILLANKIIKNIDWNDTVLLLEKLLIEIKNQFKITD
jgi:dephospho-CoA kinase